MLARLKRWCWPCIALGAGILVVSATAAGTGLSTHDTSFGFAPRDLITGLFGVVLMVVGAYIAGFRTKVDGHEKELRDLSVQLANVRLDIARSYLTKEEVLARFDKQDDNITAIHRRLDRVGFPQVKVGTDAEH